MNTPRPLPVLRVRQLRRAAFHALIGATPAVVLVEEGAKAVTGPGFRFVTPAGGIALLPEGLPLDIENRMGPRGLYQARMLGIDRMRYEKAVRISGVARPGSPVRLSRDTPSPGLVDCFERLADALRPPMTVPASVLDIMIAELVAWLAEDGLHLTREEPLSFAAMIRAMLAAHPDRDWKSEDVCMQLGVSEATLRRRLRAEGQSFLGLLTDTRMTEALALLQSTEWSIAAIALAVGYASPSRFAVRFRDRFGLLPHEIRVGSDSDDRNGIDVDRIGRATPELSI